VSAKTEPQIVFTEQGLAIEYPAYIHHEQNTHFNLHTHVINSSNGIIIDNTSTKCFIHIYNITGDHIVKLDMGYSAVDPEFELYIGAGNFSKLGSYAYIIQCNGTEGGDFVRGFFEITEDGMPQKVLSDSTSSISITVFILVIMFVILFIGLTQEFTEHKVANLIIKRCFVAVGLYLMVLNSAIMATFADVSNLGVANEMFRYMWFFGTAGWVALLILMFKTILDIITVYKEEQVKMRLGEQ